jgi:hypothetical protein
VVQYLNIDELPTKVEKELTLKGVKHVMQPITVGQFLDQAQELKARQESSEPITGAEVFEKSVKMIQTTFPTIPEDDLRALTFDKINAILAFINATADEINEAGAEQAPAADASAAEGNA